MADERMESHLREKFDHKLGQLEKRTTVGTDKPKTATRTAADEFAELLAKPGGMRQIILANEILRRREL